MDTFWCLRHEIVLMIMLVGMLSFLRITQGIRFEVDRQECVYHNVEYEGDTLHCSFVVIKADSQWHFSDDSVDLTVTGPSGEHIQDFDHRSTAIFEFVALKKGAYKFCFTNKSPYHETIDFDIHVAHFAYFDQHAKDEHINPILDQIAKLEEALFNIQFEQHWLDAQTERQLIVNQGMSRRAIHKAMIESFFLIAASFLQVYLLKRLFDQKRGLSRV